MPATLADVIAYFQANNLTSITSILRWGVDNGLLPQTATSWGGVIPCTEDNLRPKEWFCRLKVPQERRDDEANILAMAGTIYDPWLHSAEQQIVRDLSKFSQPIRIGDLEDLTQLTELKAFKALELLMRLNVKESGDLHDKRAEYFCEQYRNELSALPLRLWTSAQVVPQTGLVRC